MNIELKNNRVATINANGTVTTLTGINVVEDVKASVLTNARQAGDKVMYLNDDNVWKRVLHVGNRKKLEAFANGRIEETTTEERVMEEPKETKVEAPTVNNPVLQLITDAKKSKPSELYCDALKWKWLTRNVIRGKNIMMTGGAGTGKTYTAQMVAKGMKRPFFYFNLGATQDPRATLIGTTQFKEGEGTLFNQSTFVQAIQTEGAVILLDELSRANPEAANILMTPLDEGQRYLRLDEQEGAPTIKVAEGVCFIATANIGNEFTATRVLDRALLDRFQIFEVDELSAKEEAKLLKNKFPELRDEAIKAIAEIAEATRKEMKTESPEIETPISTRATMELAGLMFDGFKLTEAAQMTIYPLYDNEGGAQSPRTFVKQIVQKYSYIDETPQATTTGKANEDGDDLFNIINDSY